MLYVQLPVRAWSLPVEQVRIIAQQFPDVEFLHATSPDEAREFIVHADASLSSRLTPEMVATAPKLRWVHSSASAVEGLLPLAELARANVVVTNSRGVQAVPIAEHVMGGILMRTRRFDRTFAAQAERRWIQNDLAVDWPTMLHGQRMAIVGLGTIGMAIAERAHAFGIQVTGVRRTPDLAAPHFVHRVYGPDQLHDALRGRDIVVIAAPGVERTQRMIGAEELALLNPGALLVNVARAAIVDEVAMRASLESGHLGGAILDVFEREPLDAEHPLWSTPNVIITPHSAGFRASHWDEVAALFCDNLRRFLRGEPLRNPVDLSAGY